MKISDEVTVTIDRPLGTYHPEHKDIYYSINYGYIEGTIAQDNEYMDAYVLGVDKPIKSFTGKVIAIIHRKNDVEDKLVVANENSYSKEDIEKAVYFMEQYFDYEIIME